MGKNIQIIVPLQSPDEYGLKLLPYARNLQKGTTLPPEPAFPPLQANVLLLRLQVTHGSKCCQ
jgi:hypothetical protein